jgi:hypothetical protein
MCDWVIFTLFGMICSACKRRDWEDELRTDLLFFALLAYIAFWLALIGACLYVAVRLITS